MASYIRRRKFLAMLGGGAAAWPLAARAQQAMPTLGVVSIAGREATFNASGNRTDRDPIEESGVPCGENR
jgi:hypothetical protein